MANSNQHSTPPDLLTDEQKSLFRAEEIFRHEVRQEFEKNKKKSFGDQLWQLINSSFGLWLLSTVLVGTVVFTYNSIKASREAAAASSETERKLKTEISNRLQVFMASLSNLSPDQYYTYTYKQLAYTADGAVVIEQGVINQDRPLFVFPEYKERTMQSLLFELERLTKDVDESKAIAQAHIIIGRTKKRLMNMEARPDCFYGSHRVQQIEQTPNPVLSRQDSIEWISYQQQKAICEQQLSEYRKRIKIGLDSMRVDLLSNSFLKTQASD